MFDFDLRPLVVLAVIGILSLLFGVPIGLWALAHHLTFSVGWH